VKKCRTSVGARSWLGCDWSIYFLGRGLAKGEFLTQLINFNRKMLV